MVGFMESMAQDGVFPMAPTTSQAGGRVQTTTTHTTEQMAHGYQTLGVLPVGVVWYIIAAQSDDMPTVSVDVKRFDRFTKLSPPHFSGAPSEDAHDFLDRCHEICTS